MRCRVAVAIGLIALATAPPAHAGGAQKPTGKVLWQAYPLKPDATATASPTTTSRPASTPAPKATPTPAGGGSGTAWLVIGLIALTAVAGEAAIVLTRRRRRSATPSPVTADEAAPTPAPSSPRRRLFARGEPGPATPAPARTPFPRNAERLRAAVDIRLAREWPWPEGSEGLWRCEIGPDGGALSARFRAVVHPPDGGPPRVLAVAAAGPAGGDWQSAAPLEQAIDALSAQLVADGWEPVEAGGDPHTRRFCWRREGAPHGHIEETAWSA